jgi:hypothetical protein
LAVRGQKNDQRMPSAKRISGFRAQYPLIRYHIRWPMLPDEKLRDFAL